MTPPELLVWLSAALALMVAGYAACRWWQLRDPSPTIHRRP